MDFNVDPDTLEIAEGIVRFVEREVLPLEAEHSAELSSERTLYLPDGRFTPEVLALRRRIRMRSAQIGFYNLFGARELDGEGLGAIAMAHIQEVLNHRFGPGRPLDPGAATPATGRW